MTTCTSIKLQVQCSSYLEVHHLYETLNVHLKVPVPTYINKINKYIVKYTLILDRQIHIHVCTCILVKYTCNCIGFLTLL